MKVEATAARRRHTITVGDGTNTTTYTVVNAATETVGNVVTAIDSGAALVGASLVGGKIQIVAEAPYKVTDANVNQQLATLKASGAEIFFDVTTPKFAAMSIRRVAEIGWKPEHIIPTVSESISAVIQPAGLQNAEGLLSAGYYLEGDDPAIANDPGFRDYVAFMDRYMPDASKSNGLTVFSYVIANAMVTVLKKCGDDVSRENVMKQAASLKAVQTPMLIPGIVANTSAADYAPLEQMQMMQFANGRWERFGPVRSGIDPGAVSDSFKTIFRYGTSKRALADRIWDRVLALRSRPSPKALAKRAARPARRRRRRAPQP